MSKIRLITATALFDGHDVSINLFRRLLQKKGCEVIHLGHSRSVKEVVISAIEEDADAILVSSYQGGHNEYYRYMVDLLKESGASSVLVFGGGGGVILPSEITALESEGVERIYHANDGKVMGLDGIIDDILERISKAKSRRKKVPRSEQPILKLSMGNKKDIAECITFLEDNIGTHNGIDVLRKTIDGDSLEGAVVIGITGTGGSGKSSITDEIIHRFLKISPDITIGILAVDPTKSATGGALLGDRIRMNSVYSDRVYMRSLATRESPNEVSSVLGDAILVLKHAGYKVIIVETSGTGQRDHAIKSLSDKSIYVMTSEFGAPSQLEKIDMLDLADYIVLNKCLKSGAEDAFREILLNYVRSRNIKPASNAPGVLFNLDVPVYATEANDYNNPGVNKLFKDLVKDLQLLNIQFKVLEGSLESMPSEKHRDFSFREHLTSYYLSDIAAAIIKYHENVEAETEKAETCFCLDKSINTVSEESLQQELKRVYKEHWDLLKSETRFFIENWPGLQRMYSGDEIEYNIGSKNIKLKIKSETLSGTIMKKVSLPGYRSWGDLVRFFYLENLPGRFPFTAGVFPFKSTFEDPTRQFAGEGSPEKTNKRLRYLSQKDPFKRLSIAFDPITLYGENPAERLDVYGKIGESGVSIATLDDMKKLFEGFDLSNPMTSVSLTINGPSTVILAMYFMTAVAQEESRLKRSLDEEGKTELFRKLRGTLQADILKEDQAQNTCIFSLEFSLKLIGDVQKYFAMHKIRNYYSLSISGYHIAEAGANPITQLAFTLANGFHYVEYFLGLGIPVDDFAQNLSFFFSNGLEPEYSVLGRVARRIWAIAMRDRYGASEKSQKLKYHIQTSGRSLHAQEIELNDIRTTLQALLAFYDNCNSLHTNAYDEAVTTPTEESVRRAMAIQIIVAKEFGMMKNENPLQGAFVIEELSELVEKAVLEEFRRLSIRGGVLGAMEKQYQRSRIQEESLYYEELKHQGKYPVVGVNLFVKPGRAEDYDIMEVRRASPEEKQEQLLRLKAFEEKNRVRAYQALESLKKTVIMNGNIFDELLNTVRYASLGQIMNLLFELGGKYRRNM